MASSAVFSLEGRSLKLNTAADIKPHIQTLVSSPSEITQINLSGNTIGVDAAKALSAHLSKLTSLQSANLADIFTSRLLSEIPPALDALLTALLPLKQLHTVNLSDNAFGLNTQAPLVSFLEKHTPLRHLILNNNGLGPEAGTLIADALTRLANAKKADSNPAFLETIICGRNRLESGSSKAWARALAAHSSSIKEIRMTQNGIRVEGIQLILREGLKNAKGLQILDLQDNLFTLPGAQALVDVLGGWTELQELSIQDTLLRARGGIILGQALAKGQNKKLEVLKLHYNEVDAKGVKALVAAVEGDALPNLRRVELNGNRFAEDDPAVESLKETLEERREQAGAEDDDDENWGLDELDELEEDSDEEEQDEDQDEVEDKAEKELEFADEAEDEKVAQEKDGDVDDLADKLKKTEI